jgi:hypothetical protein
VTAPCECEQRHCTVEQPTTPMQKGRVSSFKLQRVLSIHQQTPPCSFAPSPLPPHPLLAVVPSRVHGGQDSEGGGRHHHLSALPAPLGQRQRAPGLQDTAWATEVSMQPMQPMQFPPPLFRCFALNGSLRCGPGRQSTHSTMWRQLNWGASGRQPQEHLKFPGEEMLHRKW